MATKWYSLIKVMRKFFIILFGTILLFEIIYFGGGIFGNYFHVYSPPSPKPTPEGIIIVVPSFNHTSLVQRIQLLFFKIFFIYLVATLITMFIVWLVGKIMHRNIYQSLNLITSIALTATIAVLVILVVPLALTQDFRLVSILLLPYSLGY